MTTTPLQALIIERIQQKGPITFAEYMRIALYEPGYGYYVAGAAKMGWEGDYYTSADLSSLFAHCMGRQLRQMWEKLGRPGRFVVVEQGAGRGQLAKGVYAWAGQEAPEFCRALEYRIEDIRFGQDAQERPSSPSIIPSTSARRGGGGAGSGGDPWVAPNTNAAPSVILSNELIDAFPVHLVEAHDGRLYEIYVAVQDGRLYEVLAEPATVEVAEYLDRYKIPWRTFGEGWRAEINLDALRWIEQTSQLIRRGFLLAIDYGDRAHTLYTHFRRRGTLACYRQHQMNERPLAHPGEQDITAHVNFSALIEEGRRYGFRLNKFTTQRVWLEGLGIHEELEQRRSHEFAAADSERATDRGQVALLRWYNLRQQVAALTDITGLGNFKVLILRR